MSPELHELLETVYNKPIIKVRTPDVIYLKTDISEEYHIDYTFTKMLVYIQDIYETNIDKLDDILYYTGFNFDEVSLKCIKQSNENLPIPIYVQIIYADTDDYSAIVDKEDSPDKIIIQLNSYKIGDDIPLLYGSLHHEFLHLREMYAKSDINILKSFKNRIPENEENKFINLRKHLFNIIKNICYVFKESEQRARVNGVYQYIVSTDKNTLLNIYDDSKSLLKNIIDNFVPYTDKLSQLNLMNEYLSKVDLYASNNNLFSEALLYYGKKYGIISKGLLVYNFNNEMFYKRNDIQLNNIINRGYNELVLRYNKFKTNMLHIIYKALKDKEIV